MDIMKYEYNCMFITQKQQCDSQTTQSRVSRVNTQHATEYQTPLVGMSCTRNALYLCFYFYIERTQYTRIVSRQSKSYLPDKLEHETNKK